MDVPLEGAVEVQAGREAEGEKDVPGSHDEVLGERQVAAEHAAQDTSEAQMDKGGRKIEERRKERQVGIGGGRDGS